MKKWAPLGWPRWQKIWFFGILGTFWLSGAIFSYQIGNKTYFHTDSSTEGMSVFAAQHYYDHGIFENYLLPTYPPFGHDPNEKQRTEPFVYNHYLAGPDLVLWAEMKIFGRDVLWPDRLIPHTLTVIGMAWVASAFAVYMDASIMGCILLSLLMIPRSLTAWSICLYGHSYVMAFYLMLMGGMLGLIKSKAPPKKASRNAWALGFAAGLLQMAFDLDWLPVTFISAVSFVVLFPDLPWKQGRRVLFGMILGGTTALIYQVAVSSLYYGSASWVVHNLVDWIFYRAGAHHVEGQTMGDLRVSRILQEYNRQTYGATGFTAFNLMALSGTFLIMGILGRVKSNRGFVLGVASVLIAYVGAAIWNLAMRQHSVAHIHFLPRHYFSLYLNFLFVSLPIAFGLVMRSRQVRTNA